MEESINLNDIGAEIGGKIEALMEEANEKQKDLASYANISYYALGKIKNGNQAINPEQLISIAKHYNVSTDYLLGLTEEKNIHMSIVKYLYDHIEISKGKHPKGKDVFSSNDLERFFSKKGFGMRLSQEIVHLLCSVANLQRVGSELKKSELIERIENISREYNSCCTSKDHSKSAFYRLLSEHDLTEAVEKHIDNAKELKSLLNSSFEDVQSDE